MGGELDVLYDGTGILKDIALRRGPVRRVVPFTVVFGARNDTQKTCLPGGGGGKDFWGIVFYLVLSRSSHDFRKITLAFLPFC